MPLVRRLQDDENCSHRKRDDEGLSFLDGNGQCKDKNGEENLAGISERSCETANIITYQGGQGADKLDLPSTRNSIPPGHFILNTKESDGSKDCNDDGSCMADAGKGHAYDEIAQGEIWGQVMLKAHKLSDDDAEHGKGLASAKITKKGSFVR